MRLPLHRTSPGSSSESSAPTIKPNLEDYMSSFNPTMDAAFRESAELELRCHHLLLDGKENDPEILAAEDRMTALWEKLDENQRRSLNGMGSDLNWVRRKGEPPPRGRQKPEDVTSIEQQELAAAMEA